jgi:sulfur relay (sulfurtransferase) DsrC/TusE family protein
LNALITSGRSYHLDRRGFLADPTQWDLAFANAMAHRLGQPGDLTLLQLKVVLFVRRHFVRQGLVARIYSTCHSCGFSLGQLPSPVATLRWTIGLGDRNQRQAAGNNFETHVFGFGPVNLNVNFATTSYKCFIVFMDFLLTLHRCGTT